MTGLRRRVLTHLVYGRGVEFAAAVCMVSVETVERVAWEGGGPS